MNKEILIIRKLFFQIVKNINFFVKILLIKIFLYSYTLLLLYIRFFIKFVLIYIIFILFINKKNKVIL
jgi:hypothetical protein